MVGTILAFEFRRRLRQVSTYVYFLVFFGLGFLFVLMSGGGLSGATVDFGTGGKVLVTSPFALVLIIMYVSFFGMVVTAALAGQATYQDVDNKTTAFFYTAPITKYDYLAGRFLGSLAVQVVIFASVGLGAWAGTHMPSLDAPSASFSAVSKLSARRWPISGRTTMRSTTTSMSCGNFLSRPGASASS
jgi:ABC-type transport system involved in multi-copper enzyme maturation permease subunit